MNPFPYLVPGLVQFRQRRWLSGLVLAGACVGLVAVLVAGEIALRRSHRRFREVAPRSLARDLWDRKAQAREEALLALLGLSLLGAVEARVGRPRTSADVGGRRAARVRIADADGPEEASADG